MNNHREYERDSKGRFVRSSHKQSDILRKQSEIELIELQYESAGIGHVRPYAPFEVVNQAMRKELERMAVERRNAAGCDDVNSL